MATAPKVPECIIPKCTKPSTWRSARCADHQLPKATIRELIESGPQFLEEIPDRDGRRCVCGDGTSPRDKETGLCRSCWRIWRWSPIREREPS